jgi:hypothetical protein
MSKRLVALSLCSAVLVGCGSGSDSSFKVDEYSISEYEGRAVNTETLAGTWVAVGTGSISSSKGSANLAFKEYFVIRETLEGYEQARCEYGFEPLMLSGNEYSTKYESDYSDELTGAVANNSQITGSGEIILYGSTTSTNFFAVKISNDVTSLGKLSLNVSQAGEVEQSSVDLYCAHQANVSGNLNDSGDITTEQYEFSDESDRALLIDKITGAVSNTWFDGYLNFDTENGDSVNFEVVGETALTLSMNISGSSDYQSGTGTVMIQLPVQ